MKFSRKIAPEIKTSPKFLTKKRLKEDEINFEKLRYDVRRSSSKARRWYREL